MGMGGEMSARFGAADGDYLNSHRRASDRAGMLGCAVARHALDAAVRRAWSWRLSRHQSGSDGRRDHCKLDPVSRALAPVELAIANWKGFVAARQGRRRLNELLNFLPPGKQFCRCQSRVASFGRIVSVPAPPGDSRDSGAGRGLRAQGRRWSWHHRT